MDDADAVKALLAAAFEELGAKPSECAMLVSELPGASKASREALATLLFNGFGVPSLLVYMQFRNRHSLSKMRFISLNHEAQVRARAVPTLHA